MAVATPERKKVSCSKLNIIEDGKNIGFNSVLYSTVIDNAGIKKQSQYSKTTFDRETYKNNILNELTANDVKVLIKHLEENSQAVKFCKIFPTHDTYKYFQYFDILPYYDKLLDAFESKYVNDIESGIAFVNT